MKNKTALGNYGENLAAQFLKKQGYKIIEHNYRIRGGEIDIIAIDDDTLVYIEVKTRSSHLFGLPEESVDYHKLKFLERAAKFYRTSRKRSSLPKLERIDVVTVDLTDGKCQINLIQNAGF